MSTADKLLTVAQNVEKVYNAGFEKGKAQGGSTPLWAQNVAKVVYTSDAWADEETVIDIPTLSSVSELFYNVQFTKIKKLTIKSDTPITAATNAFFAPMGGTAFLETLVLDCDFSECTKFDNWLMRQSKLKRIEGQPFNLSGATGLTSFAAYCYELESFRVVPKTIKVSFNINRCYAIDADTIQSIVDGLANMIDAETPPTLTLHADVKAKIEEDDALADDAVDENGDPLKKFWLRDIISKNWTLA